MYIIIHPDVDVWNFVLQGLAHRSDVLSFPLNRQCNKFQQAVRKFIHAPHLPISWLIGSSLRSQLKQLDESDTLVVCDYTTTNLLDAIKRLTPQLRYRNLWLWNKVDADGYSVPYLQLIKDSGYNIATFSSQDASRFNLVYHPQFFCIHWASSNFHYSNSLIWDFFFVGQQKNRGEEIFQIEQALHAYKCLFKVVRNTSDFVSYRDYCRLAIQSRCIIEIVPHDNPFCTLRPFEAIALGRKLLTNNTGIRKESFYHPQNIFIFGEDDISILPIFLYSPVHDLSHEIVNNHDINSWIDSFE